MFWVKFLALFVTEYIGFMFPLLGGMLRILMIIVAIVFMVRLISSVSNRLSSRAQTTYLQKTKRKTYLGK